MHTESNRSAPQQSIESSFCPAQHYSPGSSRQRAISQAIVNDLILCCSLLLCIIENEHFRHFLHTPDMKYVPISRMNAEKCIPDLVGNVKKHICETLKKDSSNSVTVDIWSDHT